MQQQPVLPVVEVQARELLDAGEAVVQGLAVDAQLGCRAAGLARAVEVDLGGAGELLMGGERSGATTESWTVCGDSEVSRRYGPMSDHSATGPSRGSARAARAAADASCQTVPSSARPVRGSPRPAATCAPPFLGGRAAGASFSSRAAAACAAVRTSGERSRTSTARLCPDAPHGTVHSAVACGTVRTDGASSGSAEGHGATQTTVWTPSARGPRAVRSSAIAMSPCQPRSAVSAARSSRLRSAPCCASSASSAPIRAATSIAAVSCWSVGPGSSSRSQT